MRRRGWIDGQIGQRFGHLVVLGAQWCPRKATTVALVRCDCGTEKAMLPENLRSGRSRSCGCMRVQWARTHGLSRTPEYAVWDQMRRRCARPTHPEYPNYGGRGIRVCNRWLRFENFYADMGPKPVGASLDRIDNDGHYEPGNCRWTTAVVQANNTRRNRVIEYGGERLTVAQWARRLRLNPSTLRQRLQAGRPLEVVMSPTLYKGRRFDGEPLDPGDGNKRKSAAPKNSPHSAPSRLHTG